MAPSAINSLAFAVARSNRKFSATMRVTPARWVASMSSRASATVRAMGLFHEDVLAVLRGEPGVLKVEIVGRDEVHGIDTGIARRILVGAVVGGTAVLLAVLPGLFDVAAGEGNIHLVGHVADVLHDRVGVFPASDDADREFFVHSSFAASGCIR